MPTTVLLIRHPESAWNAAGIYQGQMDIPLSPLGCIQAELVATHLSGEQITGITSSPLRRAHSLAQAVGRHHSVAVLTDPRLTEIGHGSWEGLPRHDVRTRFPSQYQRWLDQPHDVSFEGGESLAEVHARSVPVVSALLQRSGDETWVVVTHDTVCRLVVAASRRKPVTGFLEVALENAGITTLVGPELAGSVTRVNEVDHLGEHRVDLELQAL
ncbi:MAG: histidine phosphatase family protein [Chloroflexota bacterium]